VPTSQPEPTMSAVAVTTLIIGVFTVVCAFAMIGLFLRRV
jgi:hypothetical protein